MLVKDWMSKEVIWVRPEALIYDALKMMRTYKIRHLPVRNENGEFAGWVTDSDLRSVLVASMLEKLTVADVMIREPYVISPESHLEDAALIMVTKKVGGLPVMENNLLVGIITVIDVLRAFGEMIGTFDRGRRIDFSCPSHKYHVLPEIIRFIQGKGNKVLSVWSFHEPAQENLSENSYSIHVNTESIEPIIDKLNSMGVTILYRPQAGVKIWKSTSALANPNARVD